MQAQTPRGEAVETTIYTKPGCPYCAAAMDDMKKRGVQFRQVDAKGDMKAREEMRRLSGGLRVPTIVHPDGSVTVGFDGY
jgi:glutaredoxin 3